MDNSHSASSSRSRPSGEPADLEPSASWRDGLLDGLTQPELEDLAAYARFRLNRAGLHPALAEDVRQNAFLAVLLGSRSDLHGRHPRKADLTDRSSFIRYLKGIICSLVEARCRSREGRFTFIALDPELIGTGGPDTNEQAAIEDLAQQLFNRLQKRVPARLLPALGDWAARWRECNVIPLAGDHRRYRQELRALAAKVLEEISGDDLQWARSTKLKSWKNHE